MVELWASRLPKSLVGIVRPCVALLLNHFRSGGTASCTNLTTSALVLKASRVGLSPSPKSGPKFDPEILRIRRKSSAAACRRFRAKLRSSFCTLKSYLSSGNPAPWQRVCFRCRSTGPTSPGNENALTRWLVQRLRLTKKTYSDGSKQRDRDKRMRR